MKWSPETITKNGATPKSHMSRKSKYIIMKSKIINRMKPVLIVLTFILLMACQSEEESWNKIKASDKPSDIEAFINDFSKGKYLKEAQAYLLVVRQSTAFKDAKALNTIEAYESYLKTFPDSSAQRTEVNKVLYQLRAEKEFAEAEKLNTSDALDSFINKFPESKNIEKAKELLNKKLITNLVPDCVFICGHMAKEPKIGVWYGALTYGENRDGTISTIDPNLKKMKVVVIVFSNKGMRNKLAPGKAYLWRGENDFIFIKNIDTTLETTELLNLVGLKNYGINDFGLIRF